MYYMSRSNKAMHFVVHRKPWQRYIMTLCFSAAPVLVWLFYWYAPLQESIARDHASVVNLRKQQKVRIESQRAIKQLEDSIARLSATINTKKFQNTELAPITAALDIAHRTKMALVKSTATDVATKDGYTSNGMHANFEGALTDIISFLQTLHTSHPMSSTNDVAINFDARKQKCELSCTIEFLAPAHA